MKTVPRYVSVRMGSRAWGGLLPALVLVFSTWANAADPEVLTHEQRRAMEQALPAQATVQPAKPRRLLIFSRNVGYGGHRASRAHACEAFTLMGRKTGAFETTVSEDPVVFERESLQQYDAVFLNNTIGNAFSDPRLRQNLLEFVTGGGGLMGVHGTSIAFMDWQWPPIEDWPEFGNMIGARGAYHRDDKEQVWVKMDEPDHPLNQAFGGQSFERRDEFFRFHTPYSRRLNRVLLSMDVAKTDLSGFKPDEHLLRQDNDYAVAWIRNYGRGRVFYCSLAHSDSVFRDATMLQFYQDAAQFVLGDLNVPTTPSAKLSPAVLAQERLGWRLGIEAYTFHKFTFFETIEKTAQLGLPYLGGLSFMQRVSEDTPKNFDHYLTDDELRHVRLKLDSAGVRLLTYYAQDIPDDEAGCRRLFEFGHKMGIETFMWEPKPEQFDLLDKLANAYGINVAIHNHGQNISPHYWNPEGVLKACEGRSKRIGAAPDLGYWLRSGIDPVEAARLLKDRIITVQMHDLHAPGANGHDVPWGTGIGRSEEFLRELHRQGIKPTMIGLEYSHDWFESMPRIAQCIEFFNATTLKLAAETPNPPISAASDPIPTDGLKLWFRADRGVTHSDNKVLQWDDQSGRNLHARTKGGQPMLLASAIGGKPAIQLNGKGDMLEFSGWSPNGLTQMTLTIVCANTRFQAEPYKGGWDEGGHCGTLQSVITWPEQPGTGPGAWGNVILSAFQKSVSYRFGTGQVSNSNNWKRPASIGDSPTLTTAIHDGATEKVYVEGELVWTQTNKLTTIKNCATNGFIGRWSHGGDNSGWYAGNVAEIIVYTRALDNTDRSKVETYLKAKYFAD